MVKVPLRVLVLSFAATVYWTVSLPVPVLPCVMLTQEFVFVVNQVQPPETMTVTEPVPPSPGNESPVEPSAYVHGSTVNEKCCVSAGCARSEEQPSELQ